MLFYYCTNATFASIIKNRSLWLSDMTQSNDSYEIHRYIEIVKNAIEEKIDFITDNLGEEPQKGPKRKLYDQNKRRKTVLTQAKNSLKRLEERFYCLAICFSDRGDSLSQWRGYGDDGCGISIGFDEDKIKELSQQHFLFKYGEVQYYNNENDGSIQAKVKEYLDELENIAADAGLTRDKQSTAIKNWSRKIYENDAPFFKPAGFIEERETRFCFVREIYPSQIAVPAESSHLQDIGFHVSNSAIIPHYELKLYSDDIFLSDIIRVVMLGPSNWSNIETIKLFLAKEGFNEPTIKVNKSKIPYRSRK